MLTGQSNHCDASVQTGYLHWGTDCADTLSAAIRRSSSTTNGIARLLRLPRTFKVWTESTTLPIHFTTGRGRAEERPIGTPSISIQSPRMAVRSGNQSGMTSPAPLTMTRQKKRSSSGTLMLEKQLGLRGKLQRIRVASRSSLRRILTRSKTLCIPNLARLKQTTGLGMAKASQTTRLSKITSPSESTRSIGPVSAKASVKRNLLKPMIRKSSPA